MLAGRGIAVDRVISDFVAGAVETMLDDHADAEVALIEGQGSLIEPAYSGVTLGLMHGAAPDAMILVCQPTRTTLTHHPEVAIPPLPELVDLHERIMQPLFPSKVIGIACNTVDLSDDEARHAIEAVQLQTGLPAADVVRFDPGPLTDAIEAIL